MIDTEEQLIEGVLVGHLNSFFAPREGNLNKPIFKSSSAREIARGGGGYPDFSN